MIEQKILRTLTWEEVKADWLAMFPAAKRTNTGGLLLCFNPMDEKPSFSLRCDKPPIERKRDDAGRMLHRAHVSRAVGRV